MGLYRMVLLLIFGFFAMGSLFLTVNTVFGYGFTHETFYGLLAGIILSLVSVKFITSRWNRKISPNQRSKSNLVRTFVLIFVLLGLALLGPYLQTFIENLDRSRTGLSNFFFVVGYLLLFVFFFIVWLIVYLRKVKL